MLIVYLLCVFFFYKVKQTLKIPADVDMSGGNSDDNDDPSVGPPLPPGYQVLLSHVGHFFSQSAQKGQGKRKIFRI